MPPPINILSAGAVSPGLVKVIEAFHRETGDDVKVSFATAPQLGKRLESGEIVDVVIAPADLLDELARSGITAAACVIVGRIGVGVMVRDSAPSPMIGSAEELKQSLLSAQSIIFNQASTGLYIEDLFKRLGIAAQTQAKIIRYVDFAAVGDRLSKGRGSEIGFGAITVIIENSGKGVRYIGPLPAEVQNYTSYGAVLTANAGGAARGLLHYCAMPAAKEIFTAAGIE